MHTYDRPQDHQLHVTFDEHTTCCGKSVRPDDTIPIGPAWRCAPHHLCCPTCECQVQDYIMHLLN